MTSPIDTAAVAIVPDFTRFSSELRRGIDLALRNLIGDVDRAFERVERSAAEAGAEVGREIAAGGEVAERSLEELSRASRREFDQIERHASAAGAGIAAKLGGALAVVRTGLVVLGAAAATGLVAVTTMGLSAAASLEQTQIAFTSLLGSAEAGAQVFKDLQRFAALTPFEFAEITGVAQRFFAFNEALGLADTQVTEFLTTLGNIASITGSGAFGMERAAFAMGQIASRGAVMSEEINQLSDAFPGFNVRLAIATELGLSTADAMAKMQKGEIDAATGLQALLRAMAKFPGAAGAMEMQSRTLLGVFSTLKDTLGQALVAGFEPVIPAVKQAMLDVTPILEGAIGQIAPALGGALAGLLPLIGQLAAAITPILTPLVRGLGVIGSTLAESGALTRFGEALAEVTAAAEPLFPVLGEVAVALVEALIPALESLAPQMPELVRGTVALLEALIPVLPVLAALVASIVELSRVLPPFAVTLDTAVNMVDWPRTGREIGEFFTGIGEAMGGFFTTAAASFERLPEQARADFDRMRAAVMGRLDAMLGFVRSVPARVRTALGDLGGLLVAAGRNLINGLINGIRARLDALRATLVGVTRSIAGWKGPEDVDRRLLYPAGLAVMDGFRSGIADGVPDVAGLLGQITSAVPAMAGTGGGGNSTFNVSVNVNFAGAVSPAEAKAAGRAVADGITERLARRDIRAAVRMR